MTALPTVRRVVVIGASQAGVAVVHTLREQGYDGAVTLVGDEPYVPYERPPLSKDLLLGADPDTATLRPAQWYADQRVELRLSAPVERVDTAAGEVVLASGARLAADRVVITTGGRARRLPTMPVDERILTLRGRADAARLATYLRPGNRLVVIGAGFLGCEVAAAARTRDVEVALIEALPAPLARVTGTGVGEVLARLHREQGVQLRTATAVADVSCTADAVHVRTSSGELLAADAVLVAIGMEPSAEVAAASGLTVDDGVLVDARCRTSNPAVFAAGDVARHAHPLHGSPIRVEHYDNANAQGAAAARSLLGSDDDYANPHWFWSRQYHHFISAAGHAPRWDQLVIRGDLDAYDFCAFYLLDGVLRAALGVNRPREVKAAQRLVAAQAVVPPGALADPGTDLRSLARTISRSATRLG